MKKYFSQWPMGWKKVIIFSIAAGVYTAVVNLIIYLNGTSFQDIAINLEVWILFAMLIIMNCASRREAVVKTFVFFLLSQPLIYLIEALFSPVGFGIFRYYGYWFIVTLLTIPGAAIAYEVKRKGWLGTLSLSVAIGFLGCMAVQYYRSVTMYFPNHLLSMIFCVALAIVFIIQLIDDKEKRLFAGAVLVIAIVVSLIVSKPVLTCQLNLPEGNWSCEIENRAVASIEENTPDSFTVHALGAGSSLITFTNENGEIVEYYVTISSGGIWVDQFTD